MCCCLLNVNTRLFAEWLKCCLVVNWGGGAADMSRAFSRIMRVLCRPFSFSGICVYGRQNFKLHRRCTFLKNETLSMLKHAGCKIYSLDEERMAPF